MPRFEILQGLSIIIKASKISSKYFVNELGILKILQEYVNENCDSSNENEKFRQKEVYEILGCWSYLLAYNDTLQLLKQSPIFKG